MKILPCPKLRLRAVIKDFQSINEKTLSGKIVKVSPGVSGASDGKSNGMSTHAQSFCIPAACECKKLQTNSFA